MSNDLHVFFFYRIVDSLIGIFRIRNFIVVYSLINQTVQCDILSPLFSKSPVISSEIVRTREPIYNFDLLSILMPFTKLLNQFFFFFWFFQRRSMATVQVFYAYSYDGRVPNQAVVDSRHFSTGEMQLALQWARGAFRMRRGTVSLWFICNRHYVQAPLQVEHEDEILCKFSESIRRHVHFVTGRSKALTFLDGT